LSHSTTDRPFPIECVTVPPKIWGILRFETRPRRGTVTGAVVVLLSTSSQIPRLHSTSIPFHSSLFTTVRRSAVWATDSVVK
jgi:hypothetical protein